MKKVSKLVQKVANLRGMYVEECDDNFNMDRNYVVGRSWNNELEYFKTLEDIEFYLGIREERSIERNGHEYMQEIKYTFDEMKEKYRQELIDIKE